MRKVLLVLTILLLTALAAMAQGTPKVELFGGYSYARIEERNFNGFDISATYNLNKSVGLTADFSGLYNDTRRLFTAGVVAVGPGQTATLTSIFPSKEDYTFLVGPKFSYRNKTRFTPFGEALIGLHRISQRTVTTLIPFKGVPTSSSYQFSELLLATKLGGGLDIGVTKHIAVRAIEADYLFLNNFKNFRGIEKPHSAQLSFGLVLRLGNK